MDYFTHALKKYMNMVIIKKLDYFRKININKEIILKINFDFLMKFHLKLKVYVEKFLLKKN